MNTASTSNTQTGQRDFLQRQAQYYTQMAKEALEKLRHAALDGNGDHLATLKSSLEFFLGERRWSRKALLATA